MKPPANPLVAPANGFDDGGFVRERFLWFSCANIINARMALINVFIRHDYVNMSYVKKLQDLNNVFHELLSQVDATCVGFYTCADYDALNGLVVDEDAAMQGLTRGNMLDGHKNNYHRQTWLPAACDIRLNLHKIG